MADPAVARLTVDLDALAHNHAVLRREAVGAEVAPVVKSDGYGLGAVPVARRLWAEGARSFFVARLTEGEALRKGLGAERAASIYVLDGLTKGSGPRLAAAGLTPVISSLAQAAEAGPGPLTLQVETGMNRQGLTLDQARSLSGRPVDLVISHLGSAAELDDPRSARQRELFEAARAIFPDARASLAASAGVFRGPAYRFDLVRPGISLYGGGPMERHDDRLRAVATLAAPILDIRDLKAGDRVGYGASVAVDRPTRMAVVGAGYADGVIRASRARGYAWFAGARRPLLIVNMDLLAIDLGDAEAHVGDMVELLGPNVRLDDLAAAAGTVAHEVLVRLSLRAERRYLGQA